MQAAYYFFFYTFIGSVFMLLAIFTLYNSAGTTDYQILCCLEFNKEIQYFVFLGFLLVLLLKFLKFLFIFDSLKRTWRPRSPAL